MVDLEDPFPLAVVGKVFCFNPLQAFVWMTSTGPFPEFMKDIVINISKACLLTACL